MGGEYRTHVVRKGRGEEEMRCYREDGKDEGEVEGGELLIPWVFAGCSLS